MGTGLSPGSVSDIPDQWRGGRSSAENKKRLPYPAIGRGYSKRSVRTEEKSGQHDEKVFKRELLRLEASLRSAGVLPKLVFLHYPPRYKGYACKEILELLQQYDVRRCFFGHLHGPSHNLAMEGIWDGIEYRLLSADKLNFQPFQVI